MSRPTICDICKKEIKGSSYYKFIRPKLFSILWGAYEDIRTSALDICDECFYNIEDFIKQKNERKT